MDSQLSQQQQQQPLPLSPNSGRPSFSSPLLPAPSSPSQSTTRSPVTTPKATHICDQCSRAFSRAEHLERHQTTHLPSTATKSFVCTCCGKGFTRKDVLTRHIRAVHETKKSDVRKSRRKSCRRCAAFKIKCMGGGKGKESGGRAEEACEACKKREVECIYDFGAQVERSQESSHNDGGDMLDFASDDARSENEGSRSQEFTVKRRKTSHPGPEAQVGGQFLAPAGAVSPHLLSAARLASVESTRADQGTGMKRELSSGGPHTDRALWIGSNKMEQHQGLSIPHSYEHTPSQSFDRALQNTARPAASNFPRIVQPEGSSYYNLSNIYFPPIKDEPSILRRKSGDMGVGSIAEEDLNAANTLQGINSISPAPPDTIPDRRASMVGGNIDDRSAGAHIRSNSIDTGNSMHRPSYSSDYSQGGFQSPPAMSHQQSSNGHLLNLDPSQPQSDPGSGGPEPGDPTGVDTPLDLPEDDSFFFDFGIFDNSTDWLRDWGPNESISPESYATGEGLSGVALAAALTPAPMEYDIPGLMSGNDLTRDIGSPRSVAASDDGFGGQTPRIHHRELPPTSNAEDGVLGLPTVAPLRDNAGGGDFLPWKWQNSEEPSRKVTLPPLRVLLTEYTDNKPRYSAARSLPDDSTLHGAGTVTEEMRKEMISVLALPSTRPPYPGYDSAELDKAFPTKDVIAGFVKLYFEEFHAMFPLIHKPTFCLDRCPSMLLIAMVSIGASYSNLKNAKTFSDGLSELCKRCLSWMAENNPAYARSAFFLQSLCMQNLYAMGSGSTSLYDAADVSRSILIGNARRIGLFSGDLSSACSSPPSGPNTPTGQPVLKPDDAQETRWRKWRESEGLKRLAWGIFEYDSSFSTLSNRRGAITLSDISIRIPCSEALWEAPTATAWNALVQGGHETRGLPFYKTLKDVISGAFNPINLTSWGKRICAQAMGRIMWDFKELEESVLSVSAGVNDSFKPAKETLLRSLMRVCDGSTWRAGDIDNDQYHWVLARLIAHYTHLHAAFPTVSRMLNLARRPPAKGSESSDPRIKMLKSSFASDPTGARILAYHSAQIIALSRWRPIFSPAEGMRLFLAGVVLWGFGNYYRPTPAAPQPYPGRQEDVVRLDLLPWCLPGQASSARSSTSPEEWIRTGKGKATIGMGGDADKMMDVCGPEGTKEVLKVVVGVLGSLRVWGLGGEFKAVLEELVTRKVFGN